MGTPFRLRRYSLWILTLFLAGILPNRIRAQSLPDAPSQPATGRIYGTVTDAAGDVIPGAHVTLVPELTKQPSTLVTDAGGFFNFASLPPGNYQVTIAADGFTPSVPSEIVLSTGEYYQLPEIVLRIASANTSVNVVSSRYDIAEAQMHLEEKQRILGVFPNFYTTYDWNAAPLTAGQKYRLALRTSVDPVNILGAGVVAGIEQWQNYFSGYGQGSEGYAKRFGAAYADSFVSTMLGGAVFPALFRQDPRYFYKGTGSIRSRALYAISTVVIAKGDNGHWQPNYSNILGNFATAGISNLYYPDSNRNGAATTIDNVLIGTAAGAGTALLQEFVIKKFSHGIPPSPTQTAPPSAATQP